MGKVSPSSPSDFIRVKDSCNTAKVKRGHTNIDFFFMIGSVGGAFDQLSMKYVFGEGGIDKEASLGSITLILGNMPRFHKLKRA